MAEIHDLTALEQAHRIRRRELSPVEIAEHYLARVHRLNERVGAFITVTEELALEQARNAENRVLSETPERLPPLLGVPVAIKDLDMVAGVRWTWGSSVYGDRVAPTDEEFVRELRAAGAVLLGKTNTPEFGIACHTENTIAPPARTPWDLTRSAGGSSGGAGAAVAAGLVPVAQGSDGGGSIRIPASACGLVGIKPTRGRVTAAPVRPDLLGLSVTGPLARSVRDAARLLDTMAISRPGDYYPLPPLPEGETFESHAARPPGRLRIGRFSRPPVFEARPHPEVVAAYEAATTLLTDLGHEIVELPPPFDETTVELFETVWAAMATRYPVATADEERLTPLSRWLRRRGRELSAERYLDVTTRLQWALRAAMPVLRTCDVVLNPTLATPPVPVGHFDTGDPATEFELMKRFTPLTALYNVSGQPSVSLPLHWTPQGVPVGVMLTGDVGEEATLVSLSAQLEAARPWSARKPAMWDG